MYIKHQLAEMVNFCYKIVIVLSATCRNYTSIVIPRHMKQMERQKTKQSIKGDWILPISSGQAFIKEEFIYEML